MIDIDRILEELKVLPQYESQIMLQTTDNGLDPFEGTGRIDTLDHPEEDYIEPLFDTPYTNRVIKELGLFRTRLLVLAPYQCYSYHTDPSQRIHIPLITNPQCFMIVGYQVIWMPANGSSYLVNTTAAHTALNGSKTPRLHIVGCTNEKTKYGELWEERNHDNLD